MMYPKYDPGRILLQYTREDEVVSVIFNGGGDLTELFEKFKQFAQAMTFHIDGDIVVDSYPDPEVERLQERIMDLNQTIKELKADQPISKRVNDYIKLDTSDSESDSESDSDLEESCRFSSCCNCK